MLKTRWAVRIARISVALGCLQCACDRSPQAQEEHFFKRAEAYLAKKDYSRALLELRNAAKAMPKDAEPHYRMAIIELQQQQTGPAVRDLGDVLQLDPNHQKARVKLAELMALSGNRKIVEGAEQQLTDVLAKSPENLEAADTLAFTQWRLGKADDAAKLLEETLARVPSRLQSSIALARVKLSRKDMAGAEDVLVAAAAAAPQSGPAELALSRFYIVAGKRDLAEDHARKAAGLDPRSGLALFTLAGLQADAGRRVQAEETLGKLAALPDTRYKSLHALYLFELGRRPEAITELARLARAAPEDRSLRGQLVEAYRINGQETEAERVIADALKHNPKDVDALVLRADLYFREGRMVEAEQDLQAALHYRGDSTAAHFALARLYQATGRSRMSRQELQETLRLRPDALEARLALARVLTLDHEPDTALEVLNESPAEQRQTQAIQIERNWALRAKGDWAGYRMGVEDGLKLGRAPELLLQDGLALLRTGDFAGARADAEEILTARPEDPGGTNLLAASWAGQKQPSKAEDALRTLAAAHPNSARLQKLYGDWLRMDGNAAPAREAYRRASAADRRYLEADFALAAMDITEGKHDSARQTLNGVLQKNPRSTAALLLLGGLESDPLQSMARYRQVLELEPKNAIALNNLAYMMATSDPDGALTYAQQAVEIAPDSAMVQDTIGWIYYRKGTFDFAVRYLEAAVRKEPNPRRQFHLGLAYLKCGKTDQGHALMSQALSRDPQLAKTEAAW